MDVAPGLQAVHGPDRARVFFSAGPVFRLIGSGFRFSGDLRFKYPAGITYHTLRYLAISKTKQSA